MARHRLLRAVKICKICGEGYDAFKARDARGRYCSPACLLEARRRQREAPDVLVAVEPDSYPVPAAISLGSRDAMVILEPLHPDEAAGAA